MYPREAAFVFTFPDRRTAGIPLLGWVVTDVEKCLGIAQTGKVLLVLYSNVSLTLLLLYLPTLSVDRSYRKRDQDRGASTCYRDTGPSQRRN